MATALSKIKLSGSTNGKGIKVTGTNTAGAVTLHTAINNETDWDEVWIWAWNTDTVSRLLTIEFGGTTDPDNLIEITLQPSTSGDPVLVVPGLIIQNSLVVKAFAAAANVVVCLGFVNRIDN